MRPASPSSNARVYPPNQPQRGPGPVHRLQRPVLLPEHRQGHGRHCRDRRRPQSVQMTISTDPGTPVSLDIALKPTKESTPQARQDHEPDVKMVDEVYEEPRRRRQPRHAGRLPQEGPRGTLAACHSMVELQQAWVDKPRQMNCSQRRRADGPPGHPPRDSPPSGRRCLRPPGPRRVRRRAS